MHKATPGKWRKLPDGAVRKVPADSVPYGGSISRNGETVWAVYDGDTLIGVAATAEEARRVYLERDRPTPPQKC